MPTEYSERRSATCEECGKEFTYGYKPAFGTWKPKVCFACKDKMSSGSRRPAASKKASSSAKPITVSASVSTGIFTDGGSRGNPGRGGWGFVYVKDDQIIKEGWGGHDHTTNNRMELTAIAEALKVVGDVEAVLYSDSNLCVQTYNEWMERWAKRGWKSKSGKVANLDLVKKLYRLKPQRPGIRLQWVKGHAGNRWNEYVDGLTQRY